MDGDCIFCKIIAGKADSSIVYDDQNVIAFLDIHPINAGHTLVIPKKHATNIYDISEIDLQIISKVTQELAVKIKKVLKVDGISIFQMNERSGSQDIMHYHVHIIPRYKNDWFEGKMRKVVKRQQITNPKRQELNFVASKINRTEF